MSDHSFYEERHKNYIVQVRRDQTKDIYLIHKDIDLMVKIHL
jgi:hypothetical protein